MVTVKVDMLPSDWRNVFEKGQCFGVFGPLILVNQQARKPVVGVIAPETGLRKRIPSRLWEEGQGMNLDSEIDRLRPAFERLASDRVYFSTGMFEY
jgi:hypothetical protein